MVVLLAGLAGSPASAQTPPTLDDLLSRAAGYLQEFVDRFSNVVAEERYQQEIHYLSRTVVSGRGGAVTNLQQAAKRRVLASDFLLVKNGETNEYLVFRDVFEVDGSAVRDREQRLAKLFLQGTPEAFVQATKVSLEGSRYNLSGQGNTVNNPMTALAFLQKHYQSHFLFSLGKMDKSLGPNVWAVNYTDKLRPTLVRGPRDRDLVSHGKLWIEADTGRVLKTEIEAGPLYLVTTFRFDDAFQIAVPIEMRERLAMGSSNLLGTASYQRFRAFRVISEETIRQ